MAAAARRSRRRLAWRIASVAVAVLVFGVAGVAGVSAWHLSRSFDTQVEKIPNAFPTNQATRPRVLEGEAARAQNVLFLGSDTRGTKRGTLADISGQRSDTIMVVHIPADRQNVQVMSIMRDSWLTIPGHGEAKVNAALSWGGVALAVETVEGLLGVRVDHVAVIDFEGFQGVTDALGGVDLDNPVGFSATHSTARSFPKGPLHLDGAEALAFVRERYAFSDGDFQRVRNQQLLIRALLAGILARRTLVSPGEIGSLVGAVTPHLAVDDGLSLAYLAGIGVELRDLRADDVTFFTLPTNGTGTSPDGQSIVNVDWGEFEAVRTAFQTDTVDAYKAEVQTIG